MSIHPSLRDTEKTKKQRSVLKRSERLKILMEKGEWKEGDPIFGLPKVKTVRIKIKKEKAAEKLEATAAEGAASAPATDAAKAPSAAKAQEKK